MKNSADYQPVAVAIDPVPEPTVAAKILAFYTELTAGGLDAETVNLLVLEYAEYLLKHKDADNRKKK